jgi:predicted amidophosphoribosyltransferase
LLVRTGAPPQTGAGAVARRVGPSFAGRRGAPVPARVLLVDDIATTGSTLARAAAALHAAGAVEVHARTVAWTPLHR